MIDNLFFLYPIGILEPAVILFLIHALSNQQLGAKKILSASPFLAALAVSTRVFLGSYIISIILYTLGLIIVLTAFRYKGLTERITMSFLAFSIYLVIEFLNIKAIEVIWNIAPRQFMEDPLLYLFGFLSHMAALVIVALIVARFNVFIFEEPLRRG